MNLIKIKRVTLMLLAVLSLPIILKPVEPIYAASSTTSSEIKNLEDKLALAAKAREEAQKAVDSAKAEKADAIVSKQAIDKKILALTEEMTALEQVIEGYELSLEEKDIEIEEQSNRITDLKNAVRERARIRHEESGMDLLALLFDSDGLVDFFTGLDRYTCMLDYDRQLLASYTEALEELEAMKTSLELEKELVVEKRAKLDEKKSELDDDLAEAEKLVFEAEKDYNNAAALLENVIAEEERYNKEREEKLAELQKTTNQSYVGGKFLWPLPAKYSTVSCYYGWRIHPVTGRSQFHNGIDIPAAYGTEIYACNDGTVIEVSYNYADGSYVTISHGGGVASFYSHISKSTVKVGDKVSRGQVIAYVGTSGYTTGAHLNLNIYENNSAVDPMGYFK